LVKVRYGLGINDSGTVNHVADMICDADFLYTFVVTKEMFDSQVAGGTQWFVYASDSTSKTYIQGVGTGRCLRFRTTQPGIVSLPGTVYVVTDIIRSMSGSMPTMKLYMQEYYDGIYRGERKFFSYLQPEDKIWNQSMIKTGTVRHFRERIKPTLGADEIKWITDSGFKFVSDDWTPMMGDPCEEGEEGNPIVCWDGSTIWTTICRAGVLVPTGLTCPPMPAEGELRTPTTCWDGSEIHAETFDAALKTWVPTGEVCPTMPPHGEKRIPTTCWDGSEIHAETFDAALKTWVPTGETCPIKICEEGEKRSPHTCWDKSTINTEVCRSNAWVPSGESCPTMLPRRVMEMAIPTIGYVGQAIEIVVQAYCGVALSSGEPAILVIDGEEIRTKNTLAGLVSFKWTAAGVGMHNVCANIPVNPNCPVPGSVCKTITVSAYVAELSEQIKAEKAAYTTELERLRKLRDIEREMLAKVGVPGKVSIPPSLAGSIVEIGGIPTTVPPGGITIPVSPGESFVTIIMEGVRETIPVLVRPGAVVSLPTLPGGL
jgi:hypothetical protein